MTQTVEQRVRLTQFLGALSPNKTVALDKRLETTGEVLVDADVAGYLIVNSAPCEQPDISLTRIVRPKPPVILVERRSLIWRDVADKDLGGEWIATNLQKLWAGSRFEAYEGPLMSLGIEPPISGNHLPSDWAGKVFISARCVQWNTRAHWYRVLTPDDDILLEGRVENMSEEEIALKMNWVTRPW